jgi:hypothetical protein
MDIIESLNLWMRAKTRIPPESHSDAAYFRNTWPKRLNTCALARLQSPDAPDTRITWDVLISQATAKGVLPFETEMFIAPVTFLPLERGGCQYEYHTVAPGDFARFLKSINMQPSKLIEAWFFAYGIDWATAEEKVAPKSEAVDGEPKSKDKKESKTGRRDAQIEGICATAPKLGYSDLQNIPEGGKQAIKGECLKNRALFTDSSFDHAWREANRRGKIRMQDKEKYLSNQ